jgi:hypothetical protein
MGSVVAARRRTPEFSLHRGSAGARLRPTTFTRRIQIEASGVMGLMLPLMRPMIGKRNAGFVANLKRVLEQEAPRA